MLMEEKGIIITNHLIMVGHGVAPVIAHLLLLVHTKVVEMPHIMAVGSQQSMETVPPVRRPLPSADSLPIAFALRINGFPAFG